MWFCSQSISGKSSAIPDNSDIAAFNLDDCSFREFNARRGAVSTLSYDGKFVYVYEKKEVTKLRTL